jgi:hypothetical protein
MRTPVRALAVLAVAGAALFSAPAHAAENCAGTQEDLWVCVTTPSLHRSTIDRCVYVTGDTCTPVSVPFYGVSGGAGITCGGSLVPATDPSIC